LGYNVGHVEEKLVPKWISFSGVLVVEALGQNFDFQGLDMKALYIFSM